jgi:hypothetical protein
MRLVKFDFVYLIVLENFSSVLEEHQECAIQRGYTSPLLENIWN